MLAMYGNDGGSNKRRTMAAVVCVWLLMYLA